MKLALTLAMLLIGTASAQPLPNVIEGQQGWLYFHEELEPSSDDPSFYSEQISAIAQTVRLFADRGIHVAVAIVPTKASIYPEYLPANLHAPLDYRDSYARAQAALARQGVRIVDLKTPLQAGKAQGAMYFKGDTHWTPLGVQVAAQAIQAALAPQLHPLPQADFKVEARPPLTIPMDLARELPVDRRATYPDVQVAGLQLTSAATGLLNDSPSPAVALVGSSYSERFDHLFSKQLILTTHRDVLSADQEARGFWQPLIEYVESADYQTQPPRLLIWEIPERYLTFNLPVPRPLSSFPLLEEKVTQGTNRCASAFATCNKATSTMRYVLNWSSIDLIAGTGRYRSTNTGLFNYEGGVKHAGPDKSELTFWLPSAATVTLNYTFRSPLDGQGVQILLNNKPVKNLAAPLDQVQTAALPLKGAPGLNRLTFRYRTWNTKTTTFSNGDSRKIAVTFSKLELRR